jgi:hypothetical protein
VSTGVIAGEICFERSSLHSSQLASGTEISPGTRSECRADSPADAGHSERPVACAGADRATIGTQALHQAIQVTDADAAASRAALQAYNRSPDCRSPD